MTTIFKYLDLLIEKSSLISHKLKSSTFINIDTVEDLLDKLKTDYSDAFKKALQNNEIYRGARNYNSLFFEIIPGIRKSYGESNIYTRLLSGIFKSWKAFPKRNNSTIASFNAETASIYNKGTGFVYLVFPKNGEKIGICSNQDLWFSFHPEISLPNLNSFIIDLCFEFFGLSIEYVDTLFINGSDNDIIELFNNLSLKINETSKDEFIKKIDIIYNHSFRREMREKAILLINMYKDGKYTSFLKFLEKEIFKTDKFDIKNTNNYINNKKSEVWFEGPCLYIEKSFWEKNKNFFKKGF